MATSKAGGPGNVIDIQAEHYDVARRYIVAIVARDRRAVLDAPYSRQLTDSLWNRFFAEYALVSSGAYARHGQDAVGIALSRM
jgi:hypothetical protein